MTAKISTASRCSRRNSRIWLVRHDNLGVGVFDLQQDDHHRQREEGIGQKLHAGERDDLSEASILGFATAHG